jgi:hypothetical protein
MRMFKRFAVTVAVAGVAAGASLGAAGATPAAAATVHGQIAGAAVQHVSSGTTTISTVPGLAVGLYGMAIVPLATAPASEGATNVNGQLVLAFSFPALPSVIGLAHLTGTLNQGGGILFSDQAIKRTFTVSDFVINIANRLLIATANGNPGKRIGLFSLDLTRAKITQGKTTITATGIVASLTSAAAAELDAKFSTSAFTAGQEFGTVTTLLNYS